MAFFEPIVPYLLLFIFSSVPICGIWVILSIKRTFVSTLAFDFVYTLHFAFFYMFMYFYLIEPLRPDLPFFPLLALIYTINLVFISIFLIRWREKPENIDRNMLRLKIVFSCLGIYTVLPLVLYYLALSYFPRQAVAEKIPIREVAKQEPAASPKPPEPAASSKPPEPAAVPKPLEPAAPPKSPEPAASSKPPEPSAPPAEIPMPGKKSPPLPSLTSPPAELADYYDEWQFLGRGGFARVFKARRKDGTYVAIKIPLFMDPSIGKGFITELQNWKRLSHRNIVRILDYNILPIPYFEMELCEESLALYKKPLEPIEAAALVYDICEGLKYSHGYKTIHRDIKPQNILIKNGILKLSDWGLSKVLSESNVSSSMASFTPHYAAPEQITGKSKDARIDIWQTGVILYELTTGVLPFRGDTFVEVITSITTKAPIAPSLLEPATAPLEPIILKCLKKTPVSRYQTVVELQNALFEYLKQNYSALLDHSISFNDDSAKALYSSELMLLLLKAHDLDNAERFASVLKNIVDDSLKGRISAIKEKIHQFRITGETKIPEDVILEAISIVNMLKTYRRKKP